MHDTPDAGRLADYPPQVIFQVLLANNLTLFTEFAFGVVRPGVVFKPNWHFEAVTEKLSQVARGVIRRLIRGNAWLLCRTRTFWHAPMPMISVCSSTIQFTRPPSLACAYNGKPTARS